MLKINYIQHSKTKRLLSEWKIKETFQQGVTSRDRESCREHKCLLKH